MSKLFFLLRFYSQIAFQFVHHACGLSQRGPKNWELKFSFFIFLWCNRTHCMYQCPNTPQQSLKCSLISRPLLPAGNSSPGTWGLDAQNVAQNVAQHVAQNGCRSGPRNVAQNVAQKAPRKYRSRLSSKIKLFGPQKYFLGHVLGHRSGEFLGHRKTFWDAKQNYALVGLGCRCGPSRRWYVIADAGRAVKLHTKTSKQTCFCF